MVIRGGTHVEITSGFIKLSFSLIFLAVTTGVGLLYRLNINMEKQSVAKEFEQREDKKYKEQNDRNVQILFDSTSSHNQRLSRIEQTVSSQQKIVK